MERRFNLTIEIQTPGVAEPPVFPELCAYGYSLFFEAHFEVQTQ